MKKLFYLLLCLPLAIASCTPEQEPAPNAPDPVLILTSDDVISVKADGGQVTVDYTLLNAKEGVQFTAEYEAEWISNIVFGDSITLDVAVNESADAREAKITFKYDVASMEVTIEQAGKKENKVPAINISSEKEMEFGQDGGMGTIEYTIENPIQGVDVTASANVAWISQVTVQAEKILFQVAANTADAREGVITIVYGMLEEKVTVKQAEYVAPAPVFNFDPATLEVAYEGGAQSVAFTIENAVEGAEVAATCETAWISNLAIADGVMTFDVAANAESLRQAIIVLSYGEYTFEYIVKQLPENYNPGLNYIAFTVVDTWAELEEAGHVWNITFVEHDDLLGDMQTVISFYMEEANIHRLVSGSYSSANGTIKLNSAAQNGYSTYRANASLSTDISNAAFEVVVDTEAQTISFDGSFQAGNDVVALSYSGAVRGMDLSGNTSNEVNCTDWKWFNKNFQDETECLFTGKSSDNALEIMFHVFHHGGTKVIAAGTYNVVASYQDLTGGSTGMANSSTVTYNSVKSSFSSGYITVTHLRGMYYFEFDVTDELGRHFTGSYTGQLGNGGVNP